LVSIEPTMVSSLPLTILSMRATRVSSVSAICNARLPSVWSAASARA
jgi:hypothetical protein